MKNQQGLKLFFILSCCTAFLVAFAQVGAFAFSSISGNSFSDGIQISTVDLSGKTAAEAAPLVKEAIRNWEEAQTIKIIYKGNEQPLGSDVYQFHVEESLQAAVPGSVILKVDVDREKLIESVEAAAQGWSGTQFNLEQLTSEIITYASVLSGESVALDLQNYEVAGTKEKTSLAVSKVKLPAGTTGVEELIESIGSITIIPASQFSLNKLLEDREQLQADPGYLNMVASGIYEVFLQTNFEIIERHISSDVPVKERIGYDAIISQGRNMDLVVLNPNDQEYSLELSIENGSIAVNLVGVPFSGKFEVMVKTEEFKPKTIKRYNPLMKPDEIKVEQEGKNGLLALVTRNIFNEKGELLKTEFLSEDFYPPVHKIEISGLQPEKIFADPDASIPDTIVLPGQDASEGGNGPGEQEGVTTPPATGNGNDDPSAQTGAGGEEGNEADTKTKRNPANDDGSIWGNPGEDEK